MRESRQLVATLKRCLRSAGLAYRDVAMALELSEATIKRNFASGQFSLERLEAICQLAGLSLTDLARLADQQARLPVSLSVAQEQALADNPALLRYFYRLLSGWPAADIHRQQGLDEHAGTRLLARLDRLGLIELLAGNRVRLRTGAPITWRRDGPLWQRYADAVQKDFLQEGFRGDGASLGFESGELSAASLELLQRKLGKLGREFRDLVALDATLPPEQRRHVGALLALKPWQFSTLFDSHD